MSLFENKTSQLRELLASFKFEKSSFLRFAKTQEDELNLKIKKLIFDKDLLEKEKNNFKNEIIKIEEEINKEKK